MTQKMTLMNLALGILALSVATATFAQSASGSIHGTVLDPSGALIPAAQVTVASTNGFTRTLTSDGSGAFEVSGLAPGSYSISISAAGFTPALDSLQLSGDEVAKEEVKLRISVDQEIEVTADDSGR